MARTSRPQPKILTRRDHLLAIRKEYNLTQKQVGELTSTSVRSVECWEAGKRNMPDAKMELLLLRVASLPKAKGVPNGAA